MLPNLLEFVVDSYFEWYENDFAVVVAIVEQQVNSEMDFVDLIQL